MSKAHFNVWLKLVAVPAIIIIGGGSMTVTTAQVMPGPDFAEITEFFGNIKDDRTKVTWAHAVNSWKLLNESLAGDTMMLEADVIMGKVNNTGNDVPIMAHPPNTTSDISLSEFMMEVKKAVEGGKKKGVKLDFKSELAFNESVAVLRTMKDMKNLFPVWLNADIMKGPVNAEDSLIKPEVFLNTSRDKFPKAGLSVGWTTKISNDNTSCYKVNQLQDMVSKLKNAKLDNADNVTLAVRAVFTARCHQMFEKLLTTDLKSATITIWHSDGDVVDAKKLRELLDKVTKKRVYLDLPEKLRNEVLNGGSEPSSSNRIGSIASLLVLPLTVVLCRRQ